MNGPEQVQLPVKHVKKAVNSLFNCPPEKGDRILYIGNTEQLIVAVENYCEQFQKPIPTGVAIEINEERVKELRIDYADVDIQFLKLNFLTADLGKFEYVLGCPPMISANKLPQHFDIDRLRDEFQAAKGKFDLASLYFEHALNHLPKKRSTPSLQPPYSGTPEKGRVSMILPAGVAISESARSLRQWIIDEYHVEELYEFDTPLAVECILVTVDNRQGNKTQTKTPAGEFALPKDGDAWSRAIKGVELPTDTDAELQDICHQISAGVATGADDVFVRDADDPILRQIDSNWVHPVIGGKHLAAFDEVRSDSRIICPYTTEGIAREGELGEAFLRWVELNREKLESRASINTRHGKKPVYAWTQKPDLDTLLQPKIVTRDFADEIKFWSDDQGEYIPRRSVYSIIPKNYVDNEALLEYLNLPKVKDWIGASSQMTRGYRINARTLREVPIPSEFTAEF